MEKDRINNRPNFNLPKDTPTIQSKIYDTTKFPETYT